MNTTIENKTKFGKFCEQFPDGAVVIVKTQSGEAVNARSSGDGNAWTEHGDCFCHPEFGDKRDARENSRYWGVAAAFYPLIP